MPNDLKSGPGSAERSRKTNSERVGLEDKLLLNAENPPVKVTEDHILSILAGRRGREAAIGRELFSDPAWDILLELFAAHLGKRGMLVQELARSIDIPESTVVRWIRVLGERGLVTSVSERGERERASIELSVQGLAVMRRLVSYWGSAFQSI